MKNSKNLILSTLFAATILITTIVSCSKESESFSDLKTQSNHPNKEVSSNASSREGGEVLLGDKLYVDDPVSGDSLTVWDSYYEDDEYIYFKNGTYEEYFFKYNKESGEFDTDLPNPVGGWITCRCEFCDYPGTYATVKCWSVDNCSDCCQKLCLQFPPKDI